MYTDPAKIKNEYPTPKNTPKQWLINRRAKYDGVATKLSLDGVRYVPGNGPNHVLGHPDGRKK